MSKITDLLRAAVEKGASDLHLSARMEPRFRLNGVIEPIAGWPQLSDEELAGLLRELVSEDQWQEYCATGDLDFSIHVDNLARFRANYLRQERGTAAVFRAIPDRIATLEELRLPSSIGKLAELQSGLVLVTGPTGCGKSTTLAAIVDQINRTSARHIVTIEQPVEFVHKSIRSVFSQREVGTDTDSFASALRTAIRQDADVVLVGEMRDLETIALALRAAEMGLLVFGTLHTNSAVKTIDRLIDVFPAEEQAQTRISLAESLVAIVAQLLVPLADGSGRIAVTEIMVRTMGLPNLIREGNLPMLLNMIQAGKAQGMQLMDDVLLEFVEKKLIAPRDAYLRAQDKTKFEIWVEEE